MQKVTYGFRPSAGKFAGKEITYHGTVEDKNKFFDSLSEAMTYVVLHPDEEIPAGSLREAVFESFTVMDGDRLKEMAGSVGLLNSYEYLVRESLSKTEPPPPQKEKTPSQKQISRLFAMYKTLQDKVAELEKKVGRF